MQYFVPDRGPLKFQSAFNAKCPPIWTPTSRCNLRISFNPLLTRSVRQYNHEDESDAGEEFQSAFNAKCPPIAGVLTLVNTVIYRPFSTDLVFYHWRTAIFYHKITIKSNKINNYEPQCLSFNANLRYFNNYENFAGIQPKIFGGSWRFLFNL